MGRQVALQQGVHHLVHLEAEALERGLHEPLAQVRQQVPHTRHQARHLRPAGAGRQGAGSAHLRTAALGAGRGRGGAGRGQEAGGLGGVEHVQDVMLPHRVHGDVLPLKLLELPPDAVELVVVCQEADLGHEARHHREEGLQPLRDGSSVQEAELTHHLADTRHEVVTRDIDTCHVVIMITVTEHFEGFVFVYKVEQRRDHGGVEGGQPHVQAGVVEDGGGGGVDGHQAGEAGRDVHAVAGEVGEGVPLLGRGLGDGEHLVLLRGRVQGGDHGEAALHQVAGVLRLVPEHVAHHLGGDGRAAAREEDAHVEDARQLHQELLVQHRAPGLGAEEVLRGLLVRAEAHVHQEQLVEDDFVRAGDLLAPAGVAIVVPGEGLHDVHQPPAQQR